MGGYMFLPVKTEFDFPMIPPLGKGSIPAISAILGCWLIKKKQISYFKELGNIKYLVILFITVPFITSSLNSAPIVMPGLYIAGLTYYDGLSAVVYQFLLITPFFLGRQFFKTYKDQLMMFKLLVIACLLYSPLILFEIRMSPQLHAWIYGHFPSTFVQQMRQGGFRPIVFMGHGLSVSFFISIALIASVALLKNSIKIHRYSIKPVSFYILTILILCKSVASLLYGVFSWVLLLWAKPKKQHQLSIFLVILTLSYPILSIMKVFPHQMINNIALSVSEERAQSLNFRFENEEILLEHAKEKFYFGWGGWGRNRVYDEVTGKDKSVTDGRWIITFGQFGIFGFIAEFGLLAMVVFRAYRASKLLKGANEKNLLAAHAWILAIVMINLLPNASLRPWLWLIAGILLGRSDAIIAQSNKDRRTN